MAIKKNDFIEISFTGMIKETKEVFDTTEESVAKSNNLHDTHSKYGSRVICVGHGFVLDGIDRQLVGKSAGKYHFDVSPEEGFGKKDAKLIRMVPFKNFIANKINPAPGLQVNFDGSIGTVKTVGGGRVVVDFNHPLAGKELHYDVEIKREVSEKKEQVEALLKNIGFMRIKTTIEGNKATVETVKTVPKELSDIILPKIKELTGVDAVFVTEKSEKKQDTTPQQ